MSHDIRTTLRSYKTTLVKLCTLLSRCEPLPKASRPPRASAAGPWTVPALLLGLQCHRLAGAGHAIVAWAARWVAVRPSTRLLPVHPASPRPQITDVSVDGTQNSPNQSVGLRGRPGLRGRARHPGSRRRLLCAADRRQSATIRVYWSRASPPRLRSATLRTAAMCAPSPGR